MHPMYPQGQCCCLASQIHSCLLFLFYFAPGSLQGCPASMRANSWEPPLLRLQQFQGRWAAQDGAGWAAEVVDELVALPSAGINLCSLLTGLYLDIHAARESLCCSNAGFHSAGAGKVCSAQGIAVFPAEGEVGLKTKPEENRYQHSQLLIPPHPTQKAAGLG